jgi:Lipase (class 3)
MAVAAIAGCASLVQPSSEVYLRESGSTLKPWKSTGEAAETHWPFAWTSVSAYLHVADGKDIEVTETCPEPHAFLNLMKWQLWEELPRVGRKSTAGNELERRLQEAHLRVEVWSNEASNTVIVAFGGTASVKDIGANARWFLPFGDPDAYDVLTERYVPAFIAAYQARASRPDSAWLRSARIVSTGHSLGGGLAQRFAYSLAPTSDVPRINEVYTFNPSPVSGKRGVEGYAERARGLTIYRIYSRGEILATVRSILQWGNPGNKRSEGQTWIDIRYASDWSWRTLLPDGWVKAHGMRQFACSMKDHLPNAIQSH